MAFVREKNKKYQTFLFFCISKIIKLITQQVKILKIQETLRALS